MMDCDGMKMIDTGAKYPKSFQYNNYVGMIYSKNDWYLYNYVNNIGGLSYHQGIYHQGILYSGLFAEK